MKVANQHQAKLLYCFLAVNSREGNYLANKSIHNKFMAFILEWDDYFNEIGLNEMNIFSKHLHLNNNLRDLSYNKQMKIELDNIINKAN